MNTPTQATIGAGPNLRTGRVRPLPADNRAHSRTGLPIALAINNNYRARTRTDNAIAHRRARRLVAPVRRAGGAALKKKPRLLRHHVVTSRASTSIVIAR